MNGHFATGHMTACSNAGSVPTEYNASHATFSTAAAAAAVAAADHTQHPEYNMMLNGLLNSTTEQRRLKAEQAVLDNARILQQEVSVNTHILSDI